MYDILDRLYGVAIDSEAAVLDDLQRRAGLLWSCPLCRWNTITATEVCEQCRTHRHADLIPEPDERPCMCACGSELTPDPTTVRFDPDGTGAVSLTCQRCSTSSTHTWALDDCDFRVVFGHDPGDD